MSLTPPPAARPWSFRLMVLAVAGLLTSLGVLGSAALGRRADATRRASLISNLERLDASQRAWEARHGTFALHVDGTGSDSSLQFAPSPGVVVAFEGASEMAWSATAQSVAPLKAPRQCGIFRGERVAPHRALVREGKVACW